MADHLLAVVDRGQTPAGGLLDMQTLGVCFGGVIALAQLLQKQRAQRIAAGLFPHAPAQARLVAQLQLKEKLAQILIQPPQIRRRVGLAPQRNAVDVAHGVVGQQRVDRKQRLGAAHVDVHRLAAR